MWQSELSFTSAAAKASLVGSPFSRPHIKSQKCNFPKKIISVEHINCVSCLWEGPTCRNLLSESNDISKERIIVQRIFFAVVSDDDSCFLMFDNTRRIHGNIGTKPKKVLPACSLLAAIISLHSLPLNAFSIKSTNDLVGGITQLFPVQDVGLVAGTKSGSMYTVDQDPTPRATERCDFSFHHIGGDENTATSRPYPVYSIDASSEGDSIFCGRADRMVSVWQRTSNQTDHPVSWTQCQTLGPHTGWVKGVALDETHHLLHSIGCNCIETWQPIIDGTKKSRRVTAILDDNSTMRPATSWIHWKKSSIESSPTEGCTLSSDLLCLLLQKDLLFAGGVDGRIHVWQSSTMGAPQHSFAAHQGRVNAIVQCGEGYLVSAGSDGAVCCWDDSYTLTQHIYVGSHVRLTALSPCFEHSDPMVFAGTHTGQILLVHIHQQAVVKEVQLPDSPVINALLYVADDQILWVGHSQGLSLIDCTLS